MFLKVNKFFNILKKHQGYGSVFLSHVTQKPWVSPRLGPPEAVGGFKLDFLLPFSFPQCPPCSCVTSSFKALGKNSHKRFKSPEFPSGPPAWTSHCLASAQIKPFGKHHFHTWGVFCAKCQCDLGQTAHQPFFLSLGLKEATRWRLWPYCHPILPF